MSPQTNGSYSRASSTDSSRHSTLRGSVAQGSPHGAGTFPAQVECTADEEVWAPDGDMYVLSQNQGVRVLFRIDRHLLASRSPTLAKSIAAEVQDGVELEDATEVACSFDPLPVWAVDEHATDLRFFLHAMLQPPPHVLNAAHRGSCIPFEEAVAVARLAHRFDVRPALDAALRHLTAFYTTAFGAYHDFSHSAALDVPGDECAVAAIQIARLTDTPSVLPLAFYACALVGCPEGAGPRASVEWRRADGRVERLSVEDERVYAAGARALREAAAALHAEVYGGNGCCQEPACELTGRMLFSLTKEYDVYLMTRRQNLPVTALCRECAVNVRAQTERVRVTLWNRIPGMFGLPEPCDGGLSSCESCTM
ncbi:uncharacterized protein BXZ73DRAFT_53705 [Epithele typhae]|uniref:uncharacterized protein n=1 Tax=Epithele typhae TaxID=378194 RepID=UPI00200839DF|nr:uncharacterized protein BXZ73DRAFT_53705 [Epithele typhae]KAH9916578.1 hypothetical protein BXZ73DRAFT_53705 [Epithele typhae]